MKKIALFPGSFDPVTVGHEAIIRRALPLFEKVIIAVGANVAKSNMFPIKKRLSWLKTIFSGELRVEVRHYNGLTVDLCRNTGAKYILRGLRTSADFEFERVIAQMNRAMLPEIETVFILSAPELSAVTSTIVRDILKHGGDVSRFVPKGVVV